MMRRTRKFISARLRHWEQYTNVGLRSFIKGWAWLFSGQVVGTASAILLALGYAHFLSQEVYGTYKYILAVLGILAAFSLPGMGDAAQRAVARGKEGVFWDTFRLRLRWGMIGGAIAAAISCYYLINGNTLLGATFAAAAPFLTFSDALTHFNTLLMGRHHFKLASYYGALVQTGTAILIFCAVLITDSVFTLIVSYLAAFALMRGIAFLHVVHTDPPNHQHDETALKYGSHTSVIQILTIAANQLDAILLWHFLGPVSLAVYSFAQAGADQVRKMFKLVTTTMAFAKFSSRKKEELQLTLPRKVLLAHAITIPLAIGIAAFLPFAYHLLFPPYTESLSTPKSWCSCAPFHPCDSSQRQSSPPDQSALFTS